MKCLDWKEKISGYIDGEIPGEDARRVEEHLAGCHACRALERRMRAMGTGMEKMETAVSPDFREKLFARLEAEKLLPRRRSLFVFSFRWAAIPLAVAVAFAAFLFIAPDKRQDPGVSPVEAPRVAQNVPAQQAPSTGVKSQESPQQSHAAPLKVQETAVTPVGLSAEEREIVAHLEIFEDPAAIEDQGDVDAIEIFEPSNMRKG
ncbi:MAG: zf-HC2 domain-containing protein [Deltaproteobacteria bacterium]|nr:zf-HC2 domain-containing protein [Deltaproteobacteria bacterium]